MKGRNFTGTGPTRKQLSDFNGARAEEPIRVYVGLESADTLDERVKLAMAELDRTDAWSRKVIAVFTTTGTGWVDKRAADPLEYIHNGDTALVAMQYSYLPSWISFLVDAQKATDAGREMIHAVQARLAEMPAGQPTEAPALRREPRLVRHGTGVQERRRHDRGRRRRAPRRPGVPQSTSTTR